MSFKRLQKLLEAINTYYAFALLVYAAVLYVASHSFIFWWVLSATTPLLAGWTGYLLHGYMSRRYLLHGFKIISDVMTYEILGKDKYKLRYSLKLKAKLNHLFVFPVGYQWTGRGIEEVPEISGDRVQLIAPVNPVGPYKVSGSSEGEWHYWFAGLNPPVNKGEIVEIKYSQVFLDNEQTASPHLLYVVRTPMDRLELNVKFHQKSVPVTVSCSFFKPSDPRKAVRTKGVQFNPDKLWATWNIEKPKKGHCYRIEWSF